MTVTLCLYCSPDVQPEALGSTPSGLSEGPLGRVWPSLPHLVSSCLEFGWQLNRGFPRSPSVGWGLPYHISSLTLWESAGNCIGVSEFLLGRVWPSLPHLVSNPLVVCWQLHRGFSECPLGRVWLSLPHLVSSCLEVCWQLHRGFTWTPSVGCGLPYPIWSLLSGILLTTALGPKLNWVK